MFINLSLTVVVAALTLGMAALGGHLAAKESWHKWFFWIAACACVIAMSYQTYRSETMQARANEQFMKSQGNLSKELKNLREKSDAIWSLLNSSNPTVGLIRSQPSPRKLQAHTLPPLVPPSGTSSELSMSPSSAPPAKPEQSPEYYGSVPHVDLPPGNGVLNVVSQTPKTSTRADGPYQTEVIVQTSVVWTSLKLALECDGDLVDGSATPASGGVSMMVSIGLAKDHPNIFLYKYGSATPPFGPANPLQINLWSKKPVSCKEVTTF